MTEEFPPDFHLFIPKIGGEEDFIWFAIHQKDFSRIYFY